MNYQNITRSAISFVVLIGMFSSCQPEGRVYVKHKALSPDLEWMKSDVRIFEIPVSDTSKTYQFSLAFRYANGYQYDHLNVLLMETSPSGVIKEAEQVIKIKDETGQYVGEPGYDIWDCEQVIGLNMKFTELGTYRYVLSHNMPTDQLHFGMEIGMILDEK